MPGASYFVGRVGAAIALLGLVAVGVFALNVVRVAGSVDERALAREAASLRQGLHLMGELAAADLVSLSHWDEAVREITQRRSARWMRDNLGREVFSDPDDHRVAIADAQGAVIFASEANGRSRPEAAAALSAAVAPLAERAMSAFRDTVEKGEELYKRHGEGLVEGIYAHAVANIAGRPALVVASPVVPDLEEVETPEAPDMMFDIRFFTPLMLEHLGRTAHLEGVHLAETRPQAGQAQIQLRDVAGTAVAVLTWDHAAPGWAVLRSMRPALVLSAAIIVVLTLAVAVAIHRKTLALAQSERSALHAARHDGATGLANRRWFMAEFERLRARQGREAAPGAVLLVDCDYFKSINDTLGHDAGDAVLVAVAERLRGLGPKLDIAARLGGDEFAAILAPQVSGDAVASLVDLVSETLMQPMTFGGRVIPVSVSIGAAAFDAGASCDALLKRADLALYRAKRDGRGCWRIFDAEIDRPEPAAPAVSERREAARAA
jgi:diguanylate cyclase (GGDEF)-like protein